MTYVLKHAGYEDIELKRQDLVIKTGESLERAVELVMSLGPAGEVLRLWGDRVDEIRPKVEAALLEGWPTWRALTASALTHRRGPCAPSLRASERRSPTACAALCAR